jgi:hypothetical protein
MQAHLAATFTSAAAKQIIDESEERYAEENVDSAAGSIRGIREEKRKLPKIRYPEAPSA